MEETTANKLRGLEKDVRDLIWKFEKDTGLVVVGATLHYGMNHDGVSTGLTSISINVGTRG